MRFLLLPYIKEFSECCIEFLFVPKWADMAALDNDDLKARKDIMGVAIDEAIERYAEDYRCVIKETNREEIILV